MECAAQARSEVPQQNVDPVQLRQEAGVLPNGDDGLMATPCHRDGAEPGQAIGEHCAAASQVISRP